MARPVPPRDPAPPSAKPQAQKSGAGTKAERDRRLADALRQNLRKRKDQQRARDPKEDG
jgi:hypothetical protein